MFGSTPLGKSLGDANAIFCQSSDKKIIFIISDGEADDAEAAALHCQAMKDSGVTIVGCFLTSDHAVSKELFYREGQGWSRGAKALFNYSSSGFRNVEKPISLLVQQ